MAYDIITQANLLVDKIAPIALGKLIANLNFTPNTRNWPLPEPTENSNVYRVPKLGALAANTRAPSADVVYQDPAATKVDITTTEYETSFLVDPTLEASQGIRYLNQFIDDAMKTIAEKIETVALDAIASDGAIVHLGTLGSAPTFAQIKSLRNALSKAKTPKQDRFLVVNPDTLDDITGISEFSRVDTYGGPIQGGSGNISTAFAEGMTQRVVGFSMFENPYVKLPTPAQSMSIAFWKDAIVHIFPAQVEVSDGSTVKRGMEQDGIRVYVLRERVSGKNGGIGYTISATFGIKAVRPTNVRILDGRAV